MPSEGRRESKNVFQIPYVPHTWLFPRVSAVVHHGTTGSLSAGLKAGRPTLVIPFFGDQGFWGIRAFASGVGPRPVRAAALPPTALRPRWTVSQATLATAKPRGFSRGSSRPRTVQVAPWPTSRDSSAEAKPARAHCKLICSTLWPVHTACPLSSVPVTV